MKKLLFTLVASTVVGCGGTVDHSQLASDEGDAAQGTYSLPSSELKAKFELIKPFIGTYQPASQNSSTCSNPLAIEFAEYRSKEGTTLSHEFVAAAPTVKAETIQLEHINANGSHHQSGHWLWTRINNNQMDIYVKSIWFDIKNIGNFFSSIKLNDHAISYSLSQGQLTVKEKKWGLFNDVSCKYKRVGTRYVKILTMTDDPNNRWSEGRISID